MMPDEGLIRYVIDRRDRLVDFNDGWLAFAEANDGFALHPTRLLGRPIREFLTGATTIHLYDVICTRVREGRQSPRFRFRCDAPDKRRLLSMEIVAQEAGAIAFNVTPAIEEIRVPAAPIALFVRHDTGLPVSMCSWCKRVRLSDDLWVEVEQAIDALGLFMDSAVAPAVTHGICMTCQTTMEGAFDDPPFDTITLGPLV